MLFNSLSFLYFFPIVTLLYFLVPHKNRWLVLLLASCYFYMAFVPIYILILFFTIIIDYVAGICIEKSKGKQRKYLLLLSLVANIGILAVFKYYNFFISNINDAANISIPLLKILLPIGLSFHTFQAMSYTIEVYRGTQKAEKHFGIYALYVMFYPQLVAGPIERPQNILHQLKEKHNFDYDRLIVGLKIMFWGFVKKMVIADRLAIYVDIIYKNPEKFDSLSLLIASILFSVQIYCDFSGYSSIAIGCAKVMGIDLMENFNRPYMSKNIKEFWSRWHISLSTWFRDYVYIPLGGNRKGKFRMYINTSIVFLLSGFWHGANWTFIIWGAIHTIYIITQLIFEKKSVVKTNKSIVIDFLKMLFIFILTTFAWIFFRASSTSQAFYICQKIFTNNPFHYINEFMNVIIKTEGLSPFRFVVALMILATLLIVEYALEKKYFTNFQFSFYSKTIFYAVSILLFFILAVFQSSSQFIYFQF